VVSVQNIYIAGTGMTKFGKQPDRTIRSLAEKAVSAALADAGAQPPDIEFVFFANALVGLITGQACVPGQAALRHTGLLGIPIMNVENACASTRPPSRWHAACRRLGRCGDCGRS